MQSQVALSMHACWHATVPTVSAGDQPESLSHPWRIWLLSWNLLGVLHNHRHSLLPKKNYSSHFVFDGLQMPFVAWMGFPGSSMDEPGKSQENPGNFLDDPGKPWDFLDHPGSPARKQVPSVNHQKLSAKLPDFFYNKLW